jgi:hypothetical protein
VEAKAFRAAQRELDRAPGVPGQQCGMPLHVQVLFGSERAAVGNQRGPYLVFTEPEQAGDLPAVTPDSLALGVEVQAVVAVRVRQGRLRLEEGVLDPLGLERLRHDMRGAGQGAVHVAPLDL